MKAAQDAVDAAVKAKGQECGDVGPNCRARVADETARRAELAQAIRDQATTEQADKLEAEISAVEVIRVDVKMAEKDIDPQATAISKAFDWKLEKAALVGQIIFAVCLEIGSGLGLWLVFGHGAEQTTPKPGPTDAATAPTTRSAELEPEGETEEEAQIRLRKLFFQTCVFSCDGRLPAGVVHGAYLAWCAREGISNPMRPQAFGIKAPWANKKKIGGVVHYLNCGIAPGLIERKPALKVVANNERERPPVQNAGVCLPTRPAVP